MQHGTRFLILGVPLVGSNGFTETFIKLIIAVDIGQMVLCTIAMGTLSLVGVHTFSSDCISPSGYNCTSTIVAFTLSNLVNAFLLVDPTQQGYTGPLKGL